MFSTVRFSFFLILSINTVFANARRSKRSPMLGGTLARPYEYSYSVAIFRFNTEYICTGGIIGERYVLSAAHCFTDQDSKFVQNNYIIIAGTNDFAPIRGRYIQRFNAVKIGVMEVFIPADFDYKTSSADIAVVKLKKDLNTKKYRMQTLNLPKKWEITRVGQLGFVAGFGACQDQTSQTGGVNIANSVVVDGKLRYAKVEIIDKRKCHAKPYGNYPIEHYHFLGKMLENSDQIFGMCYGDSGSPFVDSLRTVIGVAIAISDKGCDERVLPSIYTEVTSYLDFINDVISGRISNKTCVRNLKNQNSKCTIM